jgi:nicotinamide-nucleotide amidase
MTAEIITIGDELLIGQVINTNQAYIAGQLNSVGIAVGRMTTVGDREAEILESFRHGFEKFHVVAVTGGLGPTHDDVTRRAVCKFFETDLVVNEQALENIRQLFARRGLKPERINEDQALVPRGCIVMQNRFGTAPGYFFDRAGKYFFVMPGVPFEMQEMMEDFILPFFRQRPTGTVIRHRTLKTTGIPESFLARRIGDPRDVLGQGGSTLAYLPSPTGVRLRITVHAPSEQEAERRIAAVEENLRGKVGKYIYGADNEELEDVVGRLLTERGLTIAIAESCTGGLIADRITNTAGSSAYFERAVVAYSNESKVQELEVPRALIAQHGAVSEQVCKAMANGIRTRSATAIGLSTTGIAGPTGGTPEKPVGLVWIGYADEHETIALKFNFGDNRRRVKERAAQAALELVRRKLLKIPQE